MLELNLIHGLLDKENYVAYRNYLRKEEFSKETVPILNVIDDYYKENQEPLTLDTLTNLFFAGNYKDQEYYKAVFETLSKHTTNESYRKLLQGFKNKKLCEDISVIAYEVSEGKRSPKDLHSALEKLDSPVEDKKIEFVSLDPEKLLYESYTQPGLNWRLNCLRKSLGPLRKGDFGIIYARPESGKTLCIASEVSHMINQVPDASGPILMINNEEQGEKVQVRIIQAYFGITIKEIRDNPKIITEFQTKSRGKFLLYDDKNGNLDKNLVEAICAKVSPSLIIFDQIDKLGGFSADREDLRLGSIYIWARGLAKRYCPIIGVCQADGSGEGQEFLTMANISNSKTSKAAEADWICGIGASHEHGKQYIRGISIPKNKLLGDSETDENARHKSHLVLLKPAIQRIIDIE